MLRSYACSGRKLTLKGSIFELSMPDYIYLIHPLRHEFFEHPTPQEKAAVEEHFDYLKEATARGQVLLGGP